MDIIPGINKIDKRTTAIGIDRTMSDKSIEGFALAFEDMSKYLDAELAQFKTRVKEEKIAKVERRDAYIGGSVSALTLIFLLFNLSLKVHYRKGSKTQEFRTGFDFCR